MQASVDAASETRPGGPAAVPLVGTKKAGAWVLKTAFMPIRYDGVLARSLPQLARLRIASFPTPCARSWVEPKASPRAVGRVPSRGGEDAKPPGVEGRMAAASCRWT